MKLLGQKKIVIEILGIFLFLLGSYTFVRYRNRDMQGNCIIATSFQLEDQFGKIHSFEEYKGKVIFLNFWASWCEYCMEEMPNIEELYYEYEENKRDVIILTVVSPRTKENKRGTDISLEKLQKFVKEKKYPFPVLFDMTGKTLRNYNIKAFPTTYIIKENGKIQECVSGVLTKEEMNRIISLN